MGVRMEFVRMFMYLAFPTTIFYISTLPSLFEKSVTAKYEKEKQFLRVPSESQIEQRLDELRKFRQQQMNKE